MAKKLGKLVGKGLIAVLGYGVVNVVMMGARLNKVEKSMNEHQEGNKMMQSTMCAKDEMTIQSNINDAYITCISGEATVIVDKPDNGVVNIDLFSFCGKVIIKLPKGANVEFSGDTHIEKYSDIRTDDEEKTYTVNIKKSNTLAELVIADKDEIE